uniref:Uncharacterized protein n=1 Tax=Anopheles minimus TaxID=112268 RepID=A0A182WP03_9DIPT
MKDRTKHTHNTRSGWKSRFGMFWVENFAPTPVTLCPVGVTMTSGVFELIAMETKGRLRRCVII